MRFILLLFFAFIHGCSCTGVLANTLKAKGQAESDSAYSDVFRLETPNKSLTKIGDKKVLLETGDKNLLTNSSFEHETASTGWTVGTNVTCVVETTHIIAGEGKQSLKCTATAASGHLLYQDVTPSGSVQGRNLGHIGNVKTAVAGLEVCARHASSNVLCGRVDTVDTFKEVPLNSTGPASGTIGISVYAASSFTGVFYVDAFKVGERAIAMGTIVEDPVAFTPTGNLTTNVTYTGTRARFGKYLEQETTLTFTGTNTQSFTTINLPPGLTIDTSSTGISITSLATDITIAGKFTGTNHFNLRALTNGTNNSFNVFFMNVDTTTSNAFNPDKYNGVNPASNLPEAIASGTKIYIKIRVPISGWTAGARVSDGYDAQDVALRAGKQPAQSIPNNTTTTLSNYSSVTLSEHVDFDTTTGIATIKTAGLYDISASVAWSNNATGNRLVLIQINGTGYRAVSDVPGHANSNSTGTPRTLEKLNVGDTVRVNVIQTSGGALNTHADSAYNYLLIRKETGAAYITPEGRNVTSKANNSGIESAYMTCNAGSTIHSNPGSWVASIGNIASGACTVTLTTGRFSAAPHCFTQYVDTSTGYLVQTKIHSATSSSLVVLGAQQAGATTSVPPGYSFYLFCKGAN